MIGIVDYNAGNITSVAHALEAIGKKIIVSKNPKDLENADRIIFPGVGEASFAMQELKKSGFDSFLKDWAQTTKPLMGICLGSQIIFDYSEEGNCNCLGLIPGTIKHLSKIWEDRLPTQAERDASDYLMLENSLKIPHMGWNDVTLCNGGTPLFNGIEPQSDFYFVHSYVIQPQDPMVIKGYANYGAMIPSIVSYKNITAFQFHPEKSGEKGLQILRNFAEGAE